MKLKITLILMVLLGSIHVQAQWASRAGFPGISRAKSASFTIGGKIYMMGGVTNANAILNDFWEYDMATDTWAQLPPFPGPERYGAATFVLWDKGYITCGGNDFGYLDDLWQYDPVTATWTQKNGLPAGSAQHENQRREPFSFVIGNMAYVGGGDGWIFGANSTTNYAFFDLWQYNPASDLWIPKASIPDALGRTMGIGASLNNKGYAGLGCDVGQTTNRKGFWEYDPLTNNWTAKVNFPTNFTVDAGVFTLNGQLYVVGGVNLAPVSLSGQVYKYDPAINTWTALPNFNGGAIAGNFTVSTGVSAFTGGGYTANVNTRNDFWEFTSGTTGVDDGNISNDENMKVYPNPASHELFIRKGKDIAAIEITDIAGKLVMKEERVDGVIRIDALTAGLYQLKVISADGAVTFRNFVKTNP